MSLINKYGYPALLLLLLAAWLVHFIYPVTYCIAVDEIKAAQKEKISEGRYEYHKIVLTTEAFDRAYNEDGKELNLDGKMYDVVSVEKKGDIVTCTMLSDPEETRLGQQLADHIGHEKSGKTQKQAVYWWPVAFESHDVHPAYAAFAEIKNISVLTNITTEQSGFNRRLIQPPDHSAGQPLAPITI